MRILHVNCNYVHTPLHRVMINHLSTNEIYNTVYCPIYSQYEKKELEVQPNEHVSVCFRKYDRLLYFYKQKKIINDLKFKIDVDDYDVIHAYTLMTDGNVARKLSKQFGKPYVVAVRDTDVNIFFRIKPYLRPLGVRIMRDASAVFFLSETYRSEVLQNIVPKRYRDMIAVKTYVIPNGIDDFWLNNRFTDRDIDAIQARLENKIVKVTCIGKINKRKNIPLVQQALAYLRKKGWRTNIEIIGKVEDESEYKKILMDEHSIILPPTDKNGLIKHYRKADVFVLASHTETFGLVYAEAMSQGLPVIYTRGQGFDGQFPEGEVGYAVSDTDPHEIAAAIEKLCSNYRAVSSNVIRKVQKFRWDDICEKYRDIYRGIKNVRDSI